MWNSTPVQTPFRTGARWCRCVVLAAGCVLLGLMALEDARAQEVMTSPDRVISVARGSSALLTVPDTLTRISIADPEIAEGVPLPPRELMINGKTVGTTSLFIWGRGDTPRFYTVEVTPDVNALRRQLDALYPDMPLEVSTAGNTLILTGSISDPVVVRKALELADATGATVVNNLQAPPPEQILLHVQFAEVNRSVLKEIGGELIRIVNPETLDHAFDQEDEHVVETMAEGFVNLMVTGEQSRLDAVIRALRRTGEFRSLAEPNLIAREGQEATFLAGGEFPFPVLQGGNSNAVTITWKEFGVRLNFTPTVTNSGNVRLKVMPEVSSLDFANGLTISGFEIPSLLTRRVSTDVELSPGQTLAIGGLLDNSMRESVDKIPILGDIPILGTFFKSTTSRENRTELLVLVKPHLVEPGDSVAPLPTGDPSRWEWNGHIRDMMRGDPGEGHR